MVSVKLYRQSNGDIPEIMTQSMTNTLSNHVHYTCVSLQPCHCLYMENTNHVCFVYITPDITLAFGHHGSLCVGAFDVYVLSVPAYRCHLYDLFL